MSCALSIRLSTCCPLSVGNGIMFMLSQFPSLWKIEKKYEDYFLINVTGQAAPHLLLIMVTRNNGKPFLVSVCTLASLPQQKAACSIMYFEFPKKNLFLYQTANMTVCYFTSLEANKILLELNLTLFSY